MALTELLGVVAHSATVARHIGQSMDQRGDKLPENAEQLGMVGGYPGRTRFDGNFP